jgi:nicotinate-nucleotide adenylyltransferase
MSRRIGILGGTFDPIHIAHLILGVCAQQQLSLDAVLVLPNGTPPHRPAHAEAVHRCAMAALAIQDLPHFRLCLAEMSAESTGYAFDTLLHLQKQHPDAQFSWIAGTDTLRDVPNWQNWRQVASQCRFAVGVRPGSPPEEFLLPPEIVFDRVSIPRLALSATEIRDRVANSLSVEFLVPRSVSQYIALHRLYAGPDA